MLHVSETRDRAALESFLRRDVELHLYELGDLDPFFWPHTRWMVGHDEHGELRAAVLLYDPGDGAVVLALGREDDPAPGEVLRQVQPGLARRSYAHLTPGLATALGPLAELAAPHWKMRLRHPERVKAEPLDGVETLGPEDIDPLLAFYARAYPENWFDPRMLETGMVVGLREAGELIAAGGVHVYAPGLGVAALGNITTEPAHRGRGLARRITAALCVRLHSAGVETIGLNVVQDNAPALACYSHLGFDVVAAYDEAWLLPTP